jgi:catechol 2,3-dioxygenase-like lactoylglutathione lyase family enzyme
MAVPYVPSTDQLVAEIVAQNFQQSLRFYVDLGFHVERLDEDFAELSWEAHRLFLIARAAFPGLSPIVWQHAEFPPVNVRVMVADVDDHWERAQKSAVRIVQAIGNRAYGLRDFTIADPDGIGIRFASRLAAG